MSDQAALEQLLQERSVRFGDFLLASGQRSSYYIDCRLTTMSAQGMVLIGRLGLRAIREAGWAPDAIGGLTMGADPVAYAVAAASAGRTAGHRRLQRTQGSQGARHGALDRGQLPRGRQGGGGGRRDHVGRLSGEGHQRHS